MHLSNHLSLTAIVLHLFLPNKSLINKSGKIIQIEKPSMKNIFFANYKIRIWIVIPLNNHVFRRRIQKLDSSSGLVDETSCWKLDLYFQQYCGQKMHSSLESILRQVMADVKVLDAPPNSVVSELRKSKR